MRKLIAGLLLLSAPIQAQMVGGPSSSVEGEQPWPGHGYGEVDGYRSCLAEKSAELARGNQEAAPTIVEVARSMCGGGLGNRNGMVMLFGERNVVIMERSASANAMAAVIQSRSTLR